MLKTIDLFAGIGGMRKGFEMTGFYQNVLSAEIDKYACLMYEHLYSENPFNDVTSQEFKDKVEQNSYDVLLAGFPCQAFSIAGKQLGFADKVRGTLFFDVADIIRVSKPKAFLLENVEGLFSHESGNTIKTILELLINELNYQIVGVTRDNDNKLVYSKESFVRDTKNFGLPQKRSRVYIVGFRSDLVIPNYTFPDLPKSRNKSIYRNLYDLLDEKVDERFYLSQKYVDTLERHKQNHSSKGNGFGYIIVNQGESPIANTILATGGSGKERNIILQPNPDIQGKSVAGKSTPLNKLGLRYMTPTEWGKLQGFINYAFIENNVDKFIFPSSISKTQAYKLFGNSVSIPVIEQMALYIHERLKEFNAI